MLISSPYTSLDPELETEAGEPQGLRQEEAKWEQEFRGDYVFDSIHGSEGIHDSRMVRETSQKELNLRKKL